MAEPKLLETIDGWEIRRWDYDAAKPIAIRDKGAITTVQVSEGGAPVTLDVESDDERRYTCIPLSVIRRRRRT